jgi:hypothetical protein
MRSRLFPTVLWFPVLLIVAIAWSGTVPESSAATPPATWVRSTALADAAVIDAAAWSAHGVVAVGDGAWFSPDGASWRRVLDPDELGGRLGGQEGQLDAVTPFGRGFVAAGQAVDPASNQAVAAVWTSPDGTSWTRTHDPDLEPATPAIPEGDTTPVRGSIHSIAHGATGLVAVGGVFAGTFVNGTLVGPPSEPAVWTSPDGKSWSRADVRASFGSGAVALTLNSVVAYRGSVVVAAQDGGVTRFYSSRDGHRWRTVSTVRGVVEQIDVRGNTLVAAGTEMDGMHRERATIWTSGYAHHWRRAFQSPRVPLASFTSVAASGRLFVAAGYRGRYEPLVDAAVAVSGDGRTWTGVRRTRSAFASHTYFEAATVRGKRALVFGIETTGGSGAPDDPFMSGTVLYQESSG